MGGLECFRQTMCSCKSKREESAEKRRWEGGGVEKYTIEDAMPALIWTSWSQACGTAVLLFFAPPAL